MTALPARPVETDLREVPTWRSVSRSHVGSVRTINEDRVFDCPNRQVWAVADGMGGHQGGDVAAQSVVDALRETSGQVGSIGLDGILSALASANAAIRARNDRLHLDSGATVVAAVMDDASLRIAWAGDSRAYLIRAGRMSQLTHDHSVVQELIDAGLLTVEAAERHPQANVVTRALGVPDLSRLDTISVDPALGDRILLCSDGLSRSLRADDLAGAHTLDSAADRLLANSLQRDGSDNASLIILEYGDD